MESIDTLIRSELSFLENEKGMSFAKYIQVLSTEYVYFDEKHCIVISRIDSNTIKRFVDIQDKSIYDLWTIDLRSKFNKPIYIKSNKNSYLTTEGTAFFNSKVGQDFHQRLRTIQKALLAKGDELVEKKTIEFISDYLKVHFDQLYVFCQLVDNKDFILSIKKEKTRATKRK